MTALPNSLLPGCNPMGAPMPGRIRAFIQEVLEVSSADLQGVGVALQAQLSSTVLTNTDQYRVPSDRDMVILGAAGYVQFTAMNSEPNVLTFLNLDPSERIITKAQNCTVQLTDLDRKLDLGDQRAIPLGSITPPMGGPLFFPIDAPYIVGAGHTLEATFLLVDSTAAIVGNATNYGLLLSGALIPKRA